MLAASFRCLATILETGACSQCVVLFHLLNIRVAGVEVFRSTDSTKSTVESVSDITTIIPDGVTEVAIMYGGVAAE